MNLESVHQEEVHVARGDPSPSHVLTAMNKTREEMSSAIRFTFGMGNTKEDIDFLIKVLSKIIKESKKQNQDTNLIE